MQVTELVAVVTAVVDGAPLVLTAVDGDADGARLPSGPLHSQHRSLQSGLRTWVEQQTGHTLGYVEQLYTFADRDRAGAADRVISVSYLGLTRLTAATDAWRCWYRYFPWEDRRGGSDLVTGTVAPALQDWVGAGSAAERERRQLRRAVAFGLDGRPWLPELVLQRYELLFEAGMIPEADGRTGDSPGRAHVPGTRMHQDHRRILATALARLRGKIQYRPVVFELMPDSFTLGRLQAVVESLAGQQLHKQNFRRLVTQQELVEPTGATDTGTGGRPAQLFRFRREVLDERQVAGTKLPGSR